MNTPVTNELPARPPSNESLPPGHSWKTHTPKVRPNPPRKYAPKTKYTYFFA